jgi:hypothetical protein
MRRHLRTIVLLCVLTVGLAGASLVSPGPVELSPVRCPSTTLVGLPLGDGSLDTETTVDHGSTTSGAPTTTSTSTSETTETTVDDGCSTTTSSTTTTGQTTTTSLLASTTSLPEESSTTGDQGGPTVWLLDQNSSGVDKLRVAELIGAFDYKKAPLPIGRIDVPDKPKANFADREEDRFRIEVRDPTAGTPTVDASLATGGSDAEYNDPANALKLDRVEPGLYRSQWLVLVSNTPDDLFATDGIADEADRDRTHVVALGGTVTATYKQKTATATVPVEWVASVHVTALTRDSLALVGEPIDDKNSNGTYDPPPMGTPADKQESYLDIDRNRAYTPRLKPEDAETRIKRDLKVARECFAQAGIQLKLVGDKVDFRKLPNDLPPAVRALSPHIEGGMIFISGPVNKETDLTKSEQALYKAAFNTPAGDDAEVYYVKGAGRDGPKAEGWSYASGRIDTLPDFADTLLVTDRAEPTVLAHELGHTLAANPGHDGEPENLMISGIVAAPVGLSASDLKITTPRRLNATRQADLRAKEYTKRP